MFRSRLKLKKKKNFFGYITTQTLKKCLLGHSSKFVIYIKKIKNVVLGFITSITTINIFNY